MKDFTPETEKYSSRNFWRTKHSNYFLYIRLQGLESVPNGQNEILPQSKHRFILIKDKIYIGGPERRAQEIIPRIHYMKDRLGVFSYLLAMFNFLC